MLYKTEMMEDDVHEIRRKQNLQLLLRENANTVRLLTSLPGIAEHYLAEEQITCPTLTSVLPACDKPHHKRANGFYNSAEVFGPEGKQGEQTIISAG
jgi:hypothetical protein